MKDIIKIGAVEVPLVDYAVGAAAILGIRDSGKTVTAKGIAEQLIDNGVQVIVFDAVGKWRWMKKAGQQAGAKAYKVVVAGGNDPDLPLTKDSVVEIVRAALKERIPLVIDLFSKTMSKADWRQIVQKAIHTIHYENEGGATHIFLEEAAEFCPQKVWDAETYAEIEKLVRMGGNASVGITLINQRSQEINKAVLDNCSTALVLGCQVGKNAIEAVEKWIERLDSDTAKEVTESLPRLKSGEAWVWTRKSLDKPSREHMPMCRSLHPDRRTPEKVLTSAKTTDTADFVERMSASIPKVIADAEANDPAKLKAQVAALRRDIAKLENRPAEKGSTEIKNVPALTDAERKRLTKLIDTGERIVSAFGTIFSEIQAMSVFKDNMRDELNFFRNLLSGKLLAPPQGARGNPTLLLAANRAPVVHRPVSIHRPPPPAPNGDISPVGQRILNALAEMEMLGTKTPDRELVALLAGYTHLLSKGFVNAIGELRGKGLVSYPNSDSIEFTDAGRDKAQFPDKPSTSEEIQKRVCDLIGGKSSEILRPLIDSYPNALPRSDVALAAGYTHLLSKGFVNAIGRLRTLGFVEYPDSQSIVATKILFLE